MKIRKVRYKDHPILGNLELDFVNHDTDQVYDNIIFVGENGTGKSTILETLNAFLCMEGNLSIDYLEYEINESQGGIYSASPLKGRNMLPSFYVRKNMGTGKEENIRRARNFNFSEIEQDPLDIYHYGCVLSSAKANYKTKKITSTTSTTIDDNKYLSDSDDDYTPLKQMIVDLDDADNQEYRRLNRERDITKQDPLREMDFAPNSKMYRFSHAFSEFFGNVIFSRVKTENGEKKVLFTKGDNEIAIDDLSTGEKQIVFRGAYLLRNLERLNGAIIMVDEPEMSMHPKWASRILDFYTNIFRDSNRIQKSQIFFASHSDHVVKNALKDSDKNLVIVLRIENGILNVMRMNKSTILPVITSAEVNYLAFNLPSIDLHTELFGYLQSITERNKVGEIDKYIEEQPEYNQKIHEKMSGRNGDQYHTLCSFVRNEIDHPNSIPKFSNDQLQESISLLIQIIKSARGKRVS